MTASEQELCRRYIATGDEAAFTALVEWHAGMVLAVCRRVLGSHQDAEDVTQAVFCILGQKIRSIDTARPLAPWLYGVASNLGRKALRDRQTRERHHREASTMAAASQPIDIADDIDAALGRLPERERSAIILFHLQGQSLTEIAQAFSRPESTIGRWLQGGRERLRRLLVRRGVATSAVALLTSLGSLSASEVPTGFVAATTKAAIAFTANPAAATAAAALASQGLKHMGIIHAIKTTLIAASLVLTVGTAGWIAAAESGGKPKGDPNSPLGSPTFMPTPEHPVGWRGDWTGRFPGATPPLTWSRRVKGVTSDIHYQSAKPKGEPGKDSLGLEYFTIKDWLVAGPFDAADPAKDMETDFLGGETTVQPNTGDKAGAVTWKAVHVGMDNQSCHECNIGMNADLNLDFVFLFGKVKEAAGKATIEGDYNNKLAYAHTYVHAPNGGQVRLESYNWGTASKVWLNGKLLPAADPNSKQRKLTVTLEAGWNRILVKVAGGADNYKGGVSSWRSATYLAPVQPIAYDSKNISWMTRMTGKSMSQPIVVGDRIYIGSGTTDLMCISKTDGKVLWIRANTPWEAMAKDDQDKVRAQVEPMIAQLEKLNAETVDAINALAPVAGLAAAQDGDMEKRLKDKRELEKKIHDGIATIDKKKFFPGYINEVASSNSAPVSDGKRIYWACGGGMPGAGGSSSVVAAWDFTGKRVWSWHEAVPVAEHGEHITLVLTGGKVIYGLGNQLIAFDPDTGKQVWRSTLSQNDHTKLFCGASPAPMRIGNEPGVVTPFGAVYKAADGSQVSPMTVNTFGDSTPVVEQGVCYIVNNFGGWTLYNASFVALQMPASAGAKAQIAWQVPGEEARVLLMSMAYHVSSPLFLDGIVYKVDMTGGLLAVDTAQKKKLYSRWLDGYSRYHRYLYGFVASPTAAGKRVYFTDNAGYTIVIEPGPAFKPLATNVLENVNAFNEYGNRCNQELFYSAPWFEGKAMYLRGEEYLYCIEDKTAK